MKICTIFLHVGHDLDRFLVNALTTLRAAGYDEDICVFTNVEPSATLQTALSKFNANYVLLELKDGTGTDAYSNFGSSRFNTVTHLKWQIIQRSFKRGYQLVVYSDCDIGFLADYTSFLSALSKRSPIGMQSEAEATYSTQICTGFMYFRRSLFARSVLAWLDYASGTHRVEKNDQQFFNDFLKKKPALRRRIHILPESKFPVGHLQNLVLPHPEPAVITPRFPPFLFHANWISGLENKEKMLREARLWVID